MPGHLTRNLLATADLAMEGCLTGTHLRLGMYAMMGLGVPLTKDAAVLLVRTLYPEPGDWEVVGMADFDTSSVRNRSTLEVSMGYQFLIVRMRVNGYASRSGEPWRIDIDAAGAEITPRLPAPPVRLYAQAVKSGACEVLWSYHPWGQGAFPADFVVYRGETAATIDYNTPLADAATGLGYVTAIPGQLLYRMTTAETWADGSDCYFAVRGRNSGAVEEQNEKTYGPVVAADSDPVAADILAIRQRGE